MPVIFFYMLGGAALLSASGYTIQKVGEGVNDAGSGIGKIGLTALAVGAGYLLVKGKLK